MGDGKAASPEFAFFSAFGSQPCQAWAFSVEHDVMHSGASIASSNSFMWLIL